MSLLLLKPNYSDIQIFKSLQNVAIAILGEQHQMRHRARDQVDAE